MVKTMLHYLESEYHQRLLRIVVWKQEEEASNNMMFVITYITALTGKKERIPIVNIFIFNLASKLQNDEGYA